MYGCSEPLSRACLGKSDDVSVPDATLDHQNKTDMRRRLFVHHGKVLTLRKTALFLSFPYVCPEPVLVKCSFFIYKWLKKTVFTHPLRDHVIARVERITDLRKMVALFFECFPYVCPEQLLVNCS